MTENLIWTGILTLLGKVLLTKFTAPSGYALDNTLILYMCLLEAFSSRQWLNAWLLFQPMRLRTRRITLKDLQLTMEQEKESSKSLLLFKSYLRWWALQRQPIASWSTLGIQRPIQGFSDNLRQSLLLLLLEISCHSKPRILSSEEPWMGLSACPMHSQSLTNAMFVCRQFSGDNFKSRGLCWA